MNKRFEPGDILITCGPLPPVESVFFKRISRLRFLWLRLTGRLRRDNG